MQFPSESHEITAVTFEPCGKWLTSSSSCSSTRRFAIRNQNLGLYCGAEQQHYHPWPDGRPWAVTADFSVGGAFEGWVPEGAFPPRGQKARPKREGEWRISPARRAQLEIEMKRPGAKCMVCDKEPFPGDINSVPALLWLRTADRHIAADVDDAIRRMMPKPRKSNPNWYDRLQDDLRYEVGRRFFMSRLVPDHPFSVAFLKAAKRREERGFTRALQSFGVNSMAMPVCELCNFGRGARLFEAPEDMERRWAEYRFRGNAALMRADAEYPLFARLMSLAYETDLAFEVDAQLAQRRSGNA
jgi:hypothetical protein